MAQRWRAATGAALLGPRRRAAADAWPLALSAALLLLAVVLADATPRLLTSVADEATRAAVAAYPAAGLTVTAPFDDAFVSADRDQTTAERVAVDGRTIEAALPPALARVLDPPSGLVSTTYLTTATPGGAVSLQMAYLWRDGFAGVDWLEGHAPGVPPSGVFGSSDGVPWPVAVGLSAPVAAQLGAHPGDHLAISGPDGSQLDVTVSGIFRAREPADPLWGQAPGLLEPVTLGANAGRRTVVGALLSSDSVPDARLALPPQTVTRTFTLRLRPEAVVFADLGAVARAAAALEAAPTTLGLLGPRPKVWTQLDWLAHAIQARVRAAGAQASVLLVGTLGASAAVLVLAAWLLVRRRAVVLSRHRARGASLAAVGLGLAVEQAALCVVVGAAALALAQRLVPGPISLPWVLPLLAVATLAVPVLGAATAAGATARRASSVEPDRRRSLQPSQVRRAALESALVLTSAAALVTLRRRGLPEAPGGADLLLAAAPALAALAIGVAGARALLVLFRTAVPVVARLRRAEPLLASAGAAAVPALGPFVALTMCTTLAVFSTVIGATVTAGQVAGSWDTVGADVVAHTDADHPLDAIADRVQRAPGVAEVALGRLVPTVQVLGVPGTDWVDVLAVDADDYARLTAAAPLPAVPGLSALVPGSVDDAALPVLSDAALGADGTAPALLLNGRALPLRRVGASPALSPTLAATAPTAGLVVVDREMLAAAAGEPLDADVLWALGPGAERAVGEVGLDPAAVTGRTAWLSERRSEPLTSGLLLLLRVATPILVGLGLVVIALAAAVDASRRGRTLAVLRVLGLNRRQVGRVAAGELVPWAVLATAGGLAAGVWLAALARGPLRLRLMTGQSADPPLAWQWWLLGLPVLAVVVAGAVARVQALRRSALGQVMRIGG